MKFLVFTDEKISVYLHRQVFLNENSSVILLMIDVLLQKGRTGEEFARRPDRLTFIEKEQKVLEQYGKTAIISSPEPKAHR